MKEYRQRIEARVKQLTDVLMHELQASPERAIRGGPRVARRAVTQLIRLGKSAQVSHLAHTLRCDKLAQVTHVCY